MNPFSNGENPSVAFRSDFPPGSQVSASDFDVLTEIDQTIPHDTGDVGRACFLGKRRVKGFGVRDGVEIERASGFSFDWFNDVLQVI